MKTHPGNAVPILVLNWNGWDDSEECLRSLAECEDVAEVWLIDNDSSDDRCDEARTWYPGLRVLKLDANHGWAGGYNRALAVAQEEGYRYAYLMNNDCVAKSGFLNAATCAIDADQSCATVGSCICYQEDPRTIRFDGEYHAPNSVFVSHRSGVRRVNLVNGAGMLVRLEAFRSIGCFDERYFCYAEETDWCMRARAAGWTLILAHGSMILHACEGSNVGHTSLYYRTRNSFLLLKNSPVTNRSWQFYEHLGYCVRQWTTKRGDTSSRFAIIHAISDALDGNFGQRSTSGPNRIVRALWPIWRLQVATCGLVDNVRGGWRTTRALRIRVPLCITLVSAGLRREWIADADCSPAFSIPVRPRNAIDSIRMQ